jgi:hypothetical protein
MREGIGAWLRMWPVPSELAHTPVISVERVGAHTGNAVNAFS